MADTRRKPAHPGLVVLHQLSPGRWEFLGEVDRTRGLTAKAARTKAIRDLTGGETKPGEVYVAILRSEWRVAHDWGSK